MRERLRPMGLAAVAVAVLVAFATAASRSRDSVEHLVVADASQPAFALLYLAEAHGYFAAERLEVEFRRHSLGRDALASVVAGESHLATVFDTATVAQLRAGAPLAIVTILHSSSNSHAIVARRDRGIAAPADLNGKTIGVIPGTSTEYFLAAFLANEGIAATSVKTIAVEPAGYAQALLDGLADGVVAFNPHPAALRDRLGSGAVATLRTDDHVEHSMLVGTRHGLAGKDEAVRRLLRALGRAEARWREAPVESALIAARRLGLARRSTDVAAEWEGLHLRLGLDHGLATALAHQAQWMQARSPATSPPFDVDFALAPQYLEATWPDTIAVLVAPSAP